MILGRAGTRIYALALRAFPSRHRTKYAAEMIDAFERARAERSREHGTWAALWFVVAAWANAVSAGLGERRRHRQHTTMPQRRFPFSGFLRDLVHAVRSLAKARAFTFVCATSLGVGMGTVIAILMFVRAVLGTPPGVDTHGLVEVVIAPQGPLRAQAGAAVVETWSYPDFVDLRDASTGVAISGWTYADTRLQPRTGDASTRVAMMYVSPNYFATMGVTVARGPGFDTTSRETSEPVVIVTDRLWKDRLGSDPNIIGSTITLNRVPHVVVGVAPPRFAGHLGPEASPDVMLWVPLQHHPRLQSADGVRVNRDVDWVRVHGRLTPGTTLEQANARVGALMSELARRYPSSNQHKAASVEPYSSMGAQSRGEVLAAQAMFYGLSGVVLLVVCLNVSGMVLVRSAMRERELALRLAIGASRGRLMQYILSEAVVLAFLGGTIAVAVIFGIPSLLAWWFQWWHPDLDFFVPDVWTYAMCVGLCFVTSLVFGLLPAIRFSRPTLVTALKDETGGGGRRVGRMHRLTAAIQAGIAVPFLVISGVKLDQVRTTAAADVGFETNGLFGVPVDLASSESAKQDPAFAFRSMRENLARATGVESVNVADGLPLDFRYRIVRVAREGNATPVPAHTTRVGDGYFETMGIRLLRGRGITRDDRDGAELVAVISEPLAVRLFSGAEPLGKRITFAMEGDTNQVYTVVGVTPDVVTSQMGAARPQMFLSLAQHPATRVILIARSSAADAAMASAFKNAVAHFDPDFNPASMTTGPRLMRRSMIDLSTHSLVALVCAGITLTLAALGVYGVVGLMVATRTREIGLRMALGATRPRVLGTVLRDAIKVIGPGVVGGLVLAVFLVRTADVAETWYALGGVEPLAYTMAAAVAVFVALVAGLPSARRASRVDPIIAMRAE